MSASASSRSDRSRISFFVLLLVAAIAVNLAQFRTINEGTSRSYAALQRYHTTDIATIGYPSSGIWGRYGLHFALKEIAPGATVLVTMPDGSVKRETAGRLFAFGRIAELASVGPDFAERILAAEKTFDPTPYVVASDTREGRGNPWMIAVDSPEDVRTEDPEDPLATPWRPGLLRQPDTTPTMSREFILLTWHDPEAEPDVAPFDLLLETSLLPEAVRKDLPH
jgi:hypothetical protein